MGRIRRGSWREEKSPPPAPVQVQSMNSPKPGWDDNRALGMVLAGYAPERVAELSG